MLLPSAMLQEPEPEDTPTKITYLPDEDAFLISQGEDMTLDYDEDAVENEIFVTFKQLTQIINILQNVNFIDAMMMAKNDFTKKAFH